MGMRGRQLLRRVEIPVALPVILGGVRSRRRRSSRPLTLGAIFGRAGLGRFLVEGIAQNDDGMIFGGVVLVAGLSPRCRSCSSRLQRVFVSPGLRTTIDGARPTAVDAC